MATLRVPRLDTHLELPQGIVTLLLPGGLLGAQHDELIDALRHSSREEQRGMGLGVTRVCRVSAISTNICSPPLTEIKGLLKL